MKKSLALLLTILGGLHASGFTAAAAVVIDPSGITASAGSVHSAPFPASNVLDGLTVEGWTNLGTDGPPARPANHQNNHWITADNTLSDTITFDLGGSYELVGLEILNTSNTNWNDRETDTFTIETSTDGGANYGAPSGVITLQDYTAGFQMVPLSEAGVTHLRLNVTNDPNAGANTGTADTAVGLNEVRFLQIPEPSSGLLGCFGILLILRRRR